MTSAISPSALSRSEQALVTGISGRRDHMIETLKRWSAQNSGSRNRPGLDAMRTLLMDYFSELPGVVKEEPLEAGKYVENSGHITEVDYAPAVLVTVRPDAPIQLVMTGHYDTVFPAGSDFQTPIYLDDDTINGPGTADMKGGLLVLFEALRALEQHENAQNIGYNILMSPDEEIGSPGSAPILARLGKAAHVGLTYEPALADGSMAGARKGSGNFTVIIKGRAAHAGREHHLGRNAINAVAEFAMRLDALNGQRDGVTFNMGKIDGGGAVNIVPELAIGRYNVRMVDPADMSWISQQVNAIVKDINAKDGITAELTGGFTRPPKPMAPANAQVFEWVRQAGTLLGQSIKWAPSGGVCEGNNLWASGCPNVDTLGVRGGDIHSDREYIKLSSLTERAQLSAVILFKLASGEFDAHTVKRLALDAAGC